MEEKPKIALVIPTLDQGGAEKQLCLLANGLPKDLFDVHVIVLTHTGPREAWLRERNIPMHFINKRGKLDPFAWWRLYKLFRSLKPDLVHTWLFAANAYGRSAALAAKVPVVAASERSVDPWKSEWQFWIDRFLVKRAPRITTNSSGVVDFYAKKGIESKYFSLIPNAVTPLAAKDESKESVAERLGIPSNRKWIVSVGRLWHQKGYKDLIWGAEMLRMLREDTSFLIIGEGPERNRLELYRDNIRAGSQVYLLGERTDVPEILQHADVLWNGSLYEGQSNVILEAMLSGIPVVATNIPGNRDLIQDRETGLLFAPGDVDRLTRLTNELFNDSELKCRIVENAKQRVVSEHSCEAMIQRHIELYQKWLQEKS
jgi:glycosyltransferase involved in cell wall biosynthesis